MPDCTEPTAPTSEDPIAWAKYLEKYAQYFECMWECENGSYTGMCDDIDNMQDAAADGLSYCPTPSSMPGPLSLTPSGTVLGICGQIESTAATAKAQDLTTEAGKDTYIQNMEWAKKWIGTEATGSLRDLSGC